MSNRELDRVLQEQEGIYTSSNYALDCLKSQFYKHREISQKESDEFDLYQSQFKRDIRDLEQDLNTRLHELKDYNRLRLQENKKMAKTHEEEVNDLTEIYENKLKTLREEHKKSKNTFKELIVSRETELVRLNSEIEEYKLDKDHKVNILKGQISEKSEANKTSKKQSKYVDKDVVELQGLNKELQRENALKIRKIRRLRTHASQLKQVNDAMRLGIDKLTGVAYGKGKKSKCKKSTRSKSKSKAVVKPTKQFCLKLAAKAKSKSRTTLLHSKSSKI